MKSSVYLQEDFTNDSYYTNFKGFDLWYCYEENTSRNFYILASAKKCGLLMLIDKLLTTSELEEKPEMQKQRKLILADKLIHNFYGTTITITSSENEGVISFISKTIKEADRISSNPQQHQAMVYIYAKRLLNILKVCETAQEEKISIILERSWEDFVIHFQKERLQFLTKQD